MSKSVITIRAQSRQDNTITVFGTITGLGTGTATIALPANAPANGAVSKPATALTLNAANEFEYKFTALSYGGSYAAATISATNGDGTTTQTSWPMTIPAQGASTPGTPVIVVKSFAAPAFSSAKVALGAAVTDFKIESTATGSQTNVPFTFGQPFAAGDLAPSDYLVGKIAGEADLPLQFNVKATHPDGSVRHAIISGVLPSLAAGAIKTVSMARAASGASTTPAASNTITTAGVSALVNLTIGGTVYTADATPVLAAGMPTGGAWIGGAIATEYSVNLPLKTAAGAAHAQLTAQFNVRHYPGANAAKIDVTIEHTKAYTAINDVAYTGEVRIGGVVVMPITSTLTHFPGARWKRTFWWNQASPAHIRHNVPYLLDCRAVPNYDRRTVIPESVLADYATKVGGPTFAPMGNGLFAGEFSAQGGRPELGLAPAWYAAAVISQDKRAKKLMLALADCAGSFAAHLRDASTGQPLDIAHYPFATLLGNASDGLNRYTNQSEKLQAFSSSTTYQVDSSHQSAFAYIPYLLTGDLYYLDELKFWCNYNLYFSNPGYREAVKGLVYRDQVRAQGWSLRTLGETAAITPDNDPLKPYLRFWIDVNLSWYNAQWTDSASANKLGINDAGGAFGYPNYAAVPRGIGNFMDDFFTQSLGHVAELGFTEATRLLRWKAKWQVSRFVAPGTCWIDAALYSPTVLQPDGKTLYTTIADVMVATVQSGYGSDLTMDALALPCNSPERMAKMTGTRRPLGDLGGYSDGPEGFPSNLQPALAYAVDNGYPDADIAWSLFESRSVKPDYGYGPQFSVVPRGFGVSAPGVTPSGGGGAPTPPPTPTPTPDPRYARPVVDVTPGPWVPSSSGSLAAVLGKEVPSDVDYIQATGTGTGECKVGAVTTLNPYAGKCVRYVAWNTQGGPLKVQLKQGTTVIAEWPHANLPTSPTLFERFLTKAQRDSITDYTDLRCAFIAG